MTEHDYEALGLVAGLEIHQQLDTREKLFCACPTELREPEEAIQTVTRRLHPTRSELGGIDEAALEESRLDREFEYLAYDTTCLVETDEEPPKQINPEALETALEVAVLFGMEPVDQLHVMRKIVVDGSNTAGFQRTALVARGGGVETEAGPVGIEDLMLEEESAQRVEETDGGVRYSLDRLGVPLVEIGTAPDLRTPEQAREVAGRIGMLLRSTGKVKRGLGTIRQDVNVSIEDGARVELKGVQRLDDIDDIVRLEVERQVCLLEIRDELVDRGASVGEPVDITGAFQETDSGVIRRAVDGGGVVLAVALLGFDGLVGAEVGPDRRLGTELADQARRHGAGGIFHTDELPAHGITAEEVEAVREAASAGPEDAVALVAADPAVAEEAIEAVAARSEMAVKGVPGETRGANADGTSRYLRPLPGAERMYPETDVPPVEPDPTEIVPPEPLDERAAHYHDELGIDAGMAEQVAYSERMPLFERAVELGVDPTLAANVVEGTYTELRRDGVPVEALQDRHFVGTFELLAGGDLAREGIGDLLRALAEQPDLDAAAAAEREGLGSAGADEVREVVVEVVERNVEQIETEGMGAFSALMGECMAELRGKAEGSVVSELLREEIGRRT